MFGKPVVKENADLAVEMSSGIFLDLVQTHEQHQGGKGRDQGDKCECNDVDQWHNPPKFKMNLTDKNIKRLTEG